MLEAPLDGANEALVQHGRNAPAGIVAAQQNAQQVGRRSHQIGDDAEHVPQHEILAGGLAQQARGVQGLGVVEGIQIGRFQRGNDGLVQVGKKFRKAERQAAGLG